MKKISDVLADCRVDFQEIQEHRSIRDALDLMGREGVGVLLVRVGDRVSGLFSHRELFEWMTGHGSTDLSLTALRSAMNRDTGRVELTDSCCVAVDRLIKNGLHYLTVVESGHVVGVLSGQAFLGAYTRLLESELDHLNRYLQDLHDAGLD